MAYSKIDNLDDYIKDLELELTSKNAEILHAKEVIQKLMGVNKKLLSTVVHDIYYPLMKVDSHLQEFIDFEKNSFDVVKQTFDELIAITSHVKRSINTVSETGKLYIDKTDISLTELCEYADFMFSEKLENKNLKLCLLCKDKFHFTGDPVVFKNSIFNNFISNAIKFSSPGEKIEIDTKNDDGKTITIRSYGEGISPQIQKSLEEGAIISSSPGTYNEEGTGLGIFTAKSFLEEIGGELKVFNNKRDLGLEKDGTTIEIKVS